MIHLSLSVFPDAFVWQRDRVRGVREELGLWHERRKSGEEIIMTAYRDRSREELLQLKEELEAKYQEFQG